MAYVVSQILLSLRLSQYGGAGACRCRLPGRWCLSVESLPGPAVTYNVGNV